MMWNDTGSNVTNAVKLGGVEGVNLPMKRPRLDSQSHRIIEKRRRDRINSSLADLGTLITNDCVRQGHGQGQSLMTQYAGQGRIKKTEIIEMAIQHIRHLQSELLARQRHDEDRMTTGFKECRDVTMRFLVEHHGEDSVGPLCTSLLLHLYDHLQSISGTANRTRSGYHVLHTARAPAAAANASSADNGRMADRGGSWHSDVYIKPEIEIPLESTVRPKEVIFNDSHPADMSAISFGGNSASDARKNRDERTCHEDVDGVQSHLKRMNSPEVNRPAAAIERRLEAADVGGGGGNGYKYKDNIKQRFCSEGDVHSSSHVDVRSYSSSSDGASSAPDCSPPSSPAVRRHSATVRDCCSSNRTVPITTGEFTPGFVLHPSGAYYIPVIAATAELRATAPASSLDGPQGSAVICHPVSIPVRFTGNGSATAEVVRLDETASTEHRPTQCQSLLQLQRL